MKKAFTLIELMVAVSIIAILTGVATLSYQGVRARARDAQRSNDLNQLKISLTSYYQAQTPQVYPVAASKITLNNNNDVLTTALKPNFVRNVPLDSSVTAGSRRRASAIEISSSESERVTVGSGKEVFIVVILSSTLLIAARAPSRGREGAPPQSGTP